MPIPGLAVRGSTISMLPPLDQGSAPLGVTYLATVPKVSTNPIWRYPARLMEISGTRPVRGLAITISLIPGYYFRSILNGVTYFSMHIYANAIVTRDQSRASSGSVSILVLSWFRYIIFQAT